MAGGNLESRVSVLENESEWIKRSLGAIESNTAETARSIRQLVTIEERTLTHAGAIDRAFTAIKIEQDCRKVEVGALSERLDKLEGEMPTLKLARGWVFGFVGWALLNSAGLLWIILRGASAVAAGP